MVKMKVQWWELNRGADVDGCRGPGLQRGFLICKMDQMSLALWDWVAMKEMVCGGFWKGRGGVQVLLSGSMLVGWGIVTYPRA